RPRPRALARARARPALVMARTLRARTVGWADAVGSRPDPVAGVHLGRPGRVWPSAGSRLWPRHGAGAGWCRAGPRLRRPAGYPTTQPPAFRRLSRTAADG